MPLIDDIALPFALTLAFLLGFAVRQIGLPPLVGFLGAGFLLRAVGVEANATIEAVGEFGVWLLLFTIGLKLRVDQLAKPVVWAGSGGHAALTTLLLTALLALVGLSLTEAALLAFALSFSSTVFTVKIFEEKGELGAVFAKVAIGILVMQDLFAVVFLAVSAGKLPSPWAIGLIGLVFARPLLYRLLERSGHGELLPLFGLFAAVGLGVTLFDVVGMKPDLGALALGMLLATHPRANEVAYQLFGFKEILLVGFFLTIGLSGLPGPSQLAIAAALLVVLPFKGALFFWLGTRFGLRARSAFLASLSLSTFSEFGLIVVGVATAAGWLDPAWLVTLAVAVALSFVLAAPLNALHNQLYERLQVTLKRFERPEALDDEALEDMGPTRIIVFGMGRIGTAAYDRLRMDLGDAVVGIDADPLVVAVHRRAGRRALLGDGTDVEWWDRMLALIAYRRARGMTDMQAIVLALPAYETNAYVLDKIRDSGFDGLVSVIAFNEDDVGKLKQRGADHAFEAFAEAGVGLAVQLRDRLPGPA